jgi:hypothetical protein
METIPSCDIQSQQEIETALGFALLPKKIISWPKKMWEISVGKIR